MFQPIGIPSLRLLLVVAAWLSGLVRVASAVDHEITAAISSATAARPPRLAIVTKETDAANSELLFDRLSRVREIELVERDRLKTILRELDLSVASRGADVKAGNLLGAQGLLFIEADADFRHFVLVETLRGEVLFDLLRPRAELVHEAVADQVLRQVLRYVSHLTANGRVARHIAVLPFEREDGVTPRWHDLNVLTVLVGAMLAEHPHLIVVEREHLADVLFEPAFSGCASNVLESADFVLRGSATGPGAGRIKLNLRLNSPRGGEMKATSFMATTTNLHSCALAIVEWVACEVAPGPDDRMIATDAEASFYFDRGMIYRAQGKLDPFRCFELAYELAPTNRAFATTHLGELQARWDHPVSMGTRCDYFLRALDVVRTLDPERKDAYLPLPGFLLTLSPRLPPDPARPLSWEDEVCLDARRAAENYYKKYCLYGDGLPDIMRRNLWAGICPVFFDTPEDALAHLRWLSTFDGYDWNLAGHRFLSVNYWDTNKAHKLWLAYLEDLCRHPSVAVQFQAHRAIYCYHDLLSNIIGPPTGKRAEVSARFFDWLCSDRVHSEYIQDRIVVDIHEFWRAFWYLDAAKQDSYWEKTVMPRLRRLVPYAGDRIAEVGELCGHLCRRYRYTRTMGGIGEREQILNHISRAREALQHALAAYDGGDRVRYHWDERAQSSLKGVEDAVNEAPSPSAPDPDRSVPAIAGATLLFDYRRDLPDDLWKSWPVVGTTRWVVEESRAWLGITAANQDHGSGLLTVVALNTQARTSRVCVVKAPGVGSGFFHTPVLLAKTRRHICIAEFHNVWILPLDEDGIPDEKSAFFLGPEQGMPPTGLRHVSPLDSYFVSALAGVEESFYFGISRPVLSNWDRPINYGGLFRWKSGASTVERVAACDSLETGAFNDCAPYMIEDTAKADSGNSVLFRVRTGPKIMQSYGGSSKWWTFTVPGKWEPGKATLPMLTPPLWHVTQAADGKTFALEYMVDGRRATFGVFGLDSFSPGELVLCEGGILWLISKERPLIYLIPQENWPKS